MGKIELDHTGSGSGITLSSDGTDLLLDGTAIGGGGGGGSTITVDSKTAAYTIVSGDVGKLISFSGGSYTASLTAAATLGNGFYVYIENNAANAQSTHAITIDPNASETIDGRSSIVLRQGQRILIVCDGSEWKTVSDFNRAIATNARTSFFNLPEASGAESVAIGLGSVASGDNTTAIGLNSEASANYATSFGMSSEATAFGSIAAGYNAVSAGSQSIALGVSRAGGTDSFAAGISSNSSSYGAISGYSIAMGQNAKTSSTEAIALGPYTQATANAAVSIGAFSDATAQRGFALGNYAKAGSIGKFAFSNQRYAAVGDTQGGLYVLRQQTTNATPIALTTSSGGTPSSTQIILPSGSAYAFTGTIVAKQLSSSNAAAWEVKGLIVNQGGTTTLTNSATTVISNTPSWGMALSADDTNDALAITVTGAASTIIRWVANIQTSEVSIA